MTIATILRFIAQYCSLDMTKSAAATVKEDDLLRPDEVARQLIVAESTLTAWRCTGRQKLPFVKVGGLVRYRRADVANYVKSRTALA